MRQLLYPALCGLLLGLGCQQNKAPELQADSAIAVKFIASGWKVQKVTDNPGYSPSILLVKDGYEILVDQKEKEKFCASVFKQGKSSNCLHRLWKEPKIELLLDEPVDATIPKEEFITLKKMSKEALEAYLGNIR